MSFLGWITNTQKTAPPALDEVTVAETERIIQEHGQRHELPDPRGHEPIKAQAQGLRARFDPRVTLILAGMLAVHAACYPEAKTDANLLREQLESRGFSERLYNMFRSLVERALFGVQLREAYIAERTRSILEQVDALKRAAAEAGAVPPALAAIHAGIWSSYEKLNQRGQVGASDAASRRAEGGQGIDDWRSHAMALEARLAAAEARLRQHLEDSRGAGPKRPEGHA